MFQFNIRYELCLFSYTYSSTRSSSIQSTKFKCEPSGLEARLLNSPKGYAKRKD